ncbi:MAG: sulfatase-like hydrolase/transferase [Bdellovibrionaceae bacterium]|nr:sulfatase-like hydrolase/transferase [Pseudobdellovibrionaceae bacterium]
MIESFSKQMITLEDMPFLSDLQSKSLSFENHIAPRFHSTYFSLVSILTGDSDGKLNSSNSFFKDFLNAGYSVSFFFGDSKNMFNWEDFFKQSGVFHISKKEYLKDTGRKEDIDIDGNIFEDVFLKYSVKKLKSGKVGEPPFFMTILTNQIHYPYYCSKSTNTTSSSLKKIKDCAKHVDSAIKDFFKEIENTTWFNKTLFVFTADHPNYYFWKDPVNYFSKRNIPLIFYHPNKDLSKYKDDQISSHIDIIPSLIDYLNLSKKNNLIQNSVFDLNNKRRFFIKKDRGYVLIEDNYLTEYNCQTKQSTTYLKAQTGEIKNLFNEEIIKKQDKLIKSYIQYKSLMENN